MSISCVTLYLMTNPDTFPEREPIDEALTGFIASGGVSEDQKHLMLEHDPEDLVARAKEIAKEYADSNHDPIRFINRATILSRAALGNRGLWAQVEVVTSAVQIRGAANAGAGDNVDSYQGAVISGRKTPVRRPQW